MHVIYDRTLLIRAAIADVQLTIAVAIVLVVLVICVVSAPVLDDRHPEHHHPGVASPRHWW